MAKTPTYVYSSLLIPPLFLTRMGAAAAVETPVYLIECCFPQADGDLKINAGPESAPF